MPSSDADGDGFTTEEGDCRDDSPEINPGAYDFPGNGFDEDCDGEDATEAAACDSALAMDSTDPMDGARAIGLCKTATEEGREWGVISASYTEADGSGELSGSVQSGLLPRFGAVSPPVGGSLLALSSGAARASDQAGYTSECDLLGVSCDFGCSPSQDPPSGFPKSPPDCRDEIGEDLVGSSIYNSAALELRIRVPTNANSFAFRTNFYTYEYPDYICSVFNDFFVTLVDPAPDGAENGNVVFDTEGNLVSVNSSFLRVCEPGVHNGRTFDCPLGTDQLAGTGFTAEAECGVNLDFPTPKDRGATGWLETSVPVEGGSVVTVRFAIWDTADPTLDSTVLIDAFEWSVEEPDVSTTPLI